MYLSSSLTNLPNGLATCSALACSLDHYACLFDHSLFARSYTRLYLIVRSLAGFACSLARWFEFTSLLALPYLPRSLVSVRLIARPCAPTLALSLEFHTPDACIDVINCFTPLYELPYGMRSCFSMLTHVPLQLVCTFAVSLFSPRCYIGMSAIQGATLLYVLRAAILC